MSKITLNSCILIYLLVYFLVFTLEKISKEVVYLTICVNHEAKLKLEPEPGQSDGSSLQPNAPALGGSSSETLPVAMCLIFLVFLPSRSNSKRPPKSIGYVRSWINIKGNWNISKLFSFVDFFPFYYQQKSMLRSRSFFVWLRLRAFEIPSAPTLGSTFCRQPHQRLY